MIFRIVSCLLFCFLISSCSKEVVKVENDTEVKKENLLENYLKSQTISRTAKNYKPYMGDVKLFNQYEFNLFTNHLSGNWSVMFYDLDGDSVLYALNATRKLLPASNLKVLTTGAVLKNFETSDRFYTHFITSNSSTIKNNKLEGNLYIYGDYSPQFGRNFFSYRQAFKFKKFARFLKDTLKINSIDGNITILNKSNIFLNYGKGWDNDDLSYYYAPKISPLNFNENLVKFRIHALPAEKNIFSKLAKVELGNNFQPDNINKIIKEKITGVELIPDYPFKISIQHKSGLKSPQYIRIQGTDSVVIRNDFNSFNKDIVGFLTVNNPENLFLNQLKEELQNVGITVNSKEVYKNHMIDFHRKFKTYGFLPDSLESRTVYTDSSKTIPEIVVKTNRESNNLYAESLFRINAQKLAENKDFLSNFIQNKLSDPEYKDSLDFLIYGHLLPEKYSEEHEGVDSVALAEIIATDPELLKVDSTNTQNSILSDDLNYNEEQRLTDSLYLHYKIYGLESGDFNKLNGTFYEYLFGIGPEELTLADGCGLSRMNMITSGAVIKVLRTMFHDKEKFPFYLTSFPLPGRKGTLQRKFLHDDLLERLFAKSGSMTGVNCYSGYLITKSNKRIAFSILNNYYSTSRAKINKKLEDIFLLLVDEL